MQNRNMFLYRRQGPKKRAKAGPPRKNRGSQKGLPNSARDLLPLIQPATKALAQMLAGRSGVSGQLGHARAVLAQTDRLIADRAHNRLNPAEREEFFEQVARLKLTLADADSEAEAQAADGEAPAPVAMPVDRERLKEMALALTSPGGSTSYEDRHVAAATALQETLEDAVPADGEDDTDQDIAASAGNGSEVEKQPDDPNQLRLPRAAAKRVTIRPGTIKSEANGKLRRAAKSADPEPLTPPASIEPAEHAATDEAPAKPAKVKAKANDAQKLPKGWIIDDEGFVVPGNA